MSVARSLTKLLIARRFAPFFWTQALGAFNDNLLKNVLIILVSFDGARFGSPNAGAVAGIASALFTLPFVLFAGLSGQLADRYSKQHIMRLVKVAEVAIMGVVVFGLFSSNLPVLLLALLGMGAHSTFFSPAKYGVLPELLRLDELPLGNGLLEAGTFLAILLGTLAALWLCSTHQDSIIAGGLLGVALLGALVAQFIPKTAIHQQQLQIDFNLWSSTLSNIRLARQHPAVWISIMGISWFWGIGIVVLAQIPVLVHDVLQGDERLVSGLLGGFTLGVGVGSLIGALWRQERLNDHSSRHGLAGLSVSLAIFIGVLWLQHSLAVLFGQPEMRSVMLMLCVSCIGLSGGIFVVPLYTCINTETPADIRSRVLSANSLINFLFMIIASLISSLLLSAQVGSTRLFAIIAIANIVWTPWFFRHQRRHWNHRPESVYTEP